MYDMYPADWSEKPTRTGEAPVPRRRRKPHSVDPEVPARADEPSLTEEPASEG